MKSCKRHSPAIAATSAWWLANIAVPDKALHYAWAAQRDERKGFPYTAAMEWRNAAELLSPGTRAAEYSWRQWERIMHLPRRLARPISVPAALTLAATSASATLSAIESASHQLSLATAA